MKGLYFLSALVIVLLVASYGLSKESKKEGFVNPGSDESLKSPTVIVPKVNPTYAPLEKGTPAPYLPPTEKAYGPAYGEISRINTLPYKDPSLESAPFARIAQLQESLKGFMAFEAKGLQSLSDPTVQLPLTTARGDLQRLTDEMLVLRRNPGIDSALTQGQVDEIQANLAYLQRKYRLSVNSASSGSSSELLEGFTNAASSTETTASTSQGATLSESSRLTPAEVRDLSTRIQTEIARLSNAGSTDPVMNARINNLRQMKTMIDGIVEEINRGTRTPEQIPIMKEDVQRFLPIMGNPNEPLPQLLNDLNLPATLANAFPAYQAGDASMAKAAQTLFTNYADAFSKGSWDFQVKYKSPMEIQAEKKKEEKKNPRGEMESTFFMLGGQEGKSTEPAHFDWKSKSIQICESIRKRGLNPNDFGCIDPSKVGSPDFSWRGHARMVCTRLLTTPDPGLPETCGCPPLSWPGWKL